MYVCRYRTAIQKQIKIKKAYNKSTDVYMYVRT